MYDNLYNDLSFSPCTDICVKKKKLIALYINYIKIIITSFRRLRRWGFFVEQNYHRNGSFTNHCWQIQENIYNKSQGGLLLLISITYTRQIFKKSNWRRW